MHLIRSWLSDNPWVFWAVMAAAAVLCAMCIELDKDASPLLRGIFDCTVRIGGLAVVIMPSIRALISGDRPPLSEFVLGFVALAGVTALLAEVGDPVISWATSDPISATAVGASLLLVRLVLDLSGSPSRAGAHYRSFEHVARGAVGFTRVAPRPKPSASDVRSTAAHEAGHALPHAALASLPPYFVAVVELDHGTRSLGYVTAVDDGENIGGRRPFVEWQMLMLLGGRIAQRVLLGSETLGGTSDYSKWVTLASGYLSNGIKGLFYSEPNGADQVMFNKVALDNLQREQEALLTQFFEINRSVLSDLTDALIEHGSLDATALAPFMTRVRLPEGFPNPNEAT